MFKLSKSNKLDFLKIHKKTRHIYDDLPYVKRRKWQNFFFRFLRYFSYLLLFGFAVFLLVFFLYFRDLKIFYISAISGKQNIEKAIELILAEKYQASGSMANLAQADFHLAWEIAEKHKDNLFLQHIVYWRRQLDDMSALMLSAEVLSKAVNQTNDFAQALESALVKKEKNFNRLTVEEKKHLLGIIYQSSPELTGIKANIDLALLNLKNISFSGVLLPFKAKILELEDKLQTVQDNLELIIPLSNFVPVVLGYPNKTSYLFILQNNDELRPTGGFIGTYGILQTSNGDILRMDTHDVYHLDMPVKDIFSKEPPEPLKKYLGVDKWYMRDANWSPDWPTSARQIEWFFRAEDKLLPAKNQINNFSEKFDGVIAITPKVITDLLALIGPVYIEGTEFNQNNFTELLQYKVEQEYIKLGKSSWERKAVIGEIVKELKIKLFDLDPRQLYQILAGFKANLAEKNILFYFNDIDLEELAMAKNWTGEIKQPNSDYLMVVDANMASYKTDAVMEKAIHYNISQNKTREVIANLRLSYAHHGGFDWRTTRYRTYTRVYVPRGSQLVSGEGMKDKKITVYDELGKTVFAFFINIEPGNMQSINLTYKLPKFIQVGVEDNNYILYVQKEPGSNVDQFVFTADFIKKINSYQPTGFLATKDNAQTIHWDTNLATDRAFIIELKNK